MAPKGLCADHAVNYSFNHIDTKQGLSSSYIKTIHQDQYGFMWFGTKNGLNRYDGHSVKRFDCYDKAAQRGNNNIGAIHANSDGNLWVGTDRGIYIYNPVNETFTFQSAESSDGHSAQDWVQDILSDKDGNVWALIPNQGIFRYHKNGKVDFFEVADHEGDKDYAPISLYVTSGGEVFVGTTKDGLHQFDKNTNEFHPIRNNEVFLSETPLLIREAYDGNLIVATSNGKILCYNPSTRQIIPIHYSGEGKVFARALTSVDGEIWLGTQNGLYIVNPISSSEVYLTETPYGANGLSNNCIYYIYPDSQKNIWVGTMYGGVNFFQRNGFHFDRYTSGQEPGSLISKRIRGIAEDADGTIYVGSEDRGFSSYNPATGKFNRMADDEISLIAKNFNDTVYLGKGYKGVEIIHNSKRISDNALSNFNQNSVYSFLVDNEGNKWVGSDWGVFRSPANSNKFKQIPELGQIWAFDIYQDSKGLIWIATIGGGIWKYNPATDRFIHYPYDEHASNGLHTNSISAVKEDSRGNIWFSTDRGGLVKYDDVNDRFITYSIAEGLPDNVVYDILEDSKGYLWFGTNRGLVKFNPQTAVAKVFTTNDGLLSNEFNYHSALAASDGYFYFGSLDGLITFNPDLDSHNTPVPEIHFTGLTIDSKEVEVNGEDSPLEKSIFYTDKITLPHDFSNIVFDVAAPSYTPQGTLEYTYRLVPGDTAWMPINDRSISFSNLAPGNYSLEVKVDNGTAYSTKTLSISIRTPWYRSWWALTIYALAILGFIAWQFALYKRAQDSKLREKEKLFSFNKEKELYENKVQFFTEIAHEIRTPLSLIEAPLEAMEELDIDDPRIVRNIRVMKQNTNRLLNLTSQLLDFQKIGANQFNFCMEKVDVTELLNETVARFEPTICLKGHEITTEIPQRDIYAVTDREALTKIISNLLNNALKYGNRKINVKLTADTEVFRIAVTSDGDKISAENSIRIFEPFFQANPQKDNNGVGIGLPLCRTLAHLLKGSIDIDKNDSPDNTFILTLPLRQEGMEPEPMSTPTAAMNEFVMEEASTGNSEPAQSYTLLLVEDNEEMREFLADQLSLNFVIDACANGKEALDKLNDHNYDLIITDIMMPVMDGYEFCAAVKEDINRSHIPVVFLTAKNDLDSKLKALKCGGEAYIEKPFSIKYFRQQILSLLENRKHERKAFLKQPFFSMDNMKMTKADEEFMNKVNEIINKNIADENFSVESMADVFCMSRSSLLRKIKTLFNLSPVELIRIVRLKRAAELIQEGKYRIGDVCFMVGINSSSYFSKLFFKQFGITPKGFEKQCQAKAADAKGSEVAQPAETAPAEESKTKPAPRPRKSAKTAKQQS